MVLRTEALEEDRIGTLNNDLVVSRSIILLSNKGQHPARRQNPLLTSFQYHNRIGLGLEPDVTCKGSFELDQSLALDRDMSP